MVSEVSKLKHTGAWRSGRRTCIPLVMALALRGVPALLAQGGGPTTEDLQKQAQNPVANMISVPFQNNVYFPIGHYSRVQDVLNIQPVIPIRVSKDWVLVTRWIMPIVYQPNLQAGDGGANGLGDLNPTVFVASAHPGKVIAAFGPTFFLPTATERSLGQGKWSAGPSLVVLVQPPHFTIGFLANNVWSFAGQRNRAAVNQGSLQYFVNYNLKNGWYVGTSPIITANWRANGHNRWTVPFGWQAGKIYRVGTLPLNTQLGAFYNVIHPLDLPYPKWQVRLQTQLLFPTSK